MRLGLFAIGVTIITTTGCHDPSPPPPNTPVPVARVAQRYEDPVKPLPDPSDDAALPAPPFRDEPILYQPAPEQRAFVEAYENVGRPRIVVFVNRTLEGQLVPVNADDPAVSVQRTRDTRGDVIIESRDRTTTDVFRDRDDAETTNRLDARGPSAQVRDRVEVYLNPGQYDEAAAKAIDYEAIENILTDWLAAGGRTEIISPTTARQRLTDEQVKDLQDGRPRAAGEVARELDAEVLVQVTARPTRQTQRGLDVRLVAEAINVGKGGQSIGRAVVDVPPPLDKPQINKYTRFLARKLMDGMIGSWESLPPAGEPEVENRNETNPELPPATLPNP